MPARAPFPARIGKYEIQRALGKGAVGTVYLARDGFSGQDIALKVIDPGFFKHPEFREVYRPQFQIEASLAGKLDHPHIVSIFDAVLTDVQMPRLDGFELTRRLKANAATAGLPVIIMSSLASAEDKRRGADAGADAYLIKGDLGLESLAEVLDRLT